MSTTSTRIIHTGLYGIQAKEVLDSVHGQLSDGKWENTPGYDKYWVNFRVKQLDDGEVVFEVNADYSTSYCGKWLNNPFKNMSDIDFKTWYAKKTKAVIRDEIPYNGLSPNAWNRKNTNDKSTFLGHSDAKYGAIVTIADVYCVYEALLGREDSIAKYDTSTICRVFGSKRTDEETAKVKSTREAVDAIYAKYNEKIASLREEQKEMVRKFEEKLNHDINALLDEQKKEIAKAIA